MLIVGVDCATQPKNTGLARATLDGSTLVVHEASVGTGQEQIVETLAAWLLAGEQAVLALDAPLGWPKALGEALSLHQAGRLIDVHADTLFQRETDRVLRRALQKKPLEIGADRIARTALVALRLIDDLKKTAPLALGWSPGAVRSRQAIEVYPAATLVGRGISAKGYKHKDAVGRRSEILSALNIDVHPVIRELAVKTDHVLDAVIACVAGADYAHGDVEPPQDPELARREGWIWFRPGLP